MKAVILICLCLCCAFCEVANAQYYGTAAAGGGGVTAYPPYPPYPPPVYPQPQTFAPPYFPHDGGGGPSGQMTLLQLLAIQNLLNQQTEVQRGWQDRASDKLGIVLAQQEGFRTAQANRDQFEWLQRFIQCQQHQFPHHFPHQFSQFPPFPYPFPRPAPIPPRRRFFFRGGGVTVGADAGGGYGGYGAGY